MRHVPAQHCEQLEHGRLALQPNGSWVWRPSARAARAGWVYRQKLGRNEGEARRRAAELEGEIGAHIRRFGDSTAPTVRPGPPHPADVGAVLTASVAADGSWTVTRGGETVLSGAPRFRALELLRAEGVGGLVELGDDV